jgi:hypothetical protein
MDKVNSRHKISDIPAVFILTLLLSLTMFFPSSARSGPNINITVKSILASEKGTSVDPRLKGLVQELQSVFRYSSYEYLGEKDLSISLNNKSVITLPGQRVMNIFARGIEGDRVVLEIELLNNNSRIAQTSIKLRNHSSFTIGGQGYNGGYLLFNIFASF